MTTDNKTLARTEAEGLPDRDDLGDASGRARPVYTRVQVLGLALVGVTVLAIAVVTVVASPGHTMEVLSFFGPVAIVTLLVAWLAWRFGMWARVTGILVSLAAGFLLSWSLYGLAAPDSLADFALALGAPLGVLLGIAGGVAAVVAGWRGQIEVAPRRVEQRLVRGVLAVVGVALLASAVLTLAGRASVDPGMVAGATAVEMTGFAFEPVNIHVNATDARLVVANTDPFLHDLTVPALPAGVRVAPGSTVSLNLSGATPGTYTVYCTLHSDTRVDDPQEAGMAALLIVS